MNTVPAQVFLLAVVSLAAYRAWRLLGHDDITEPLREPLANSDRPGVVKVYEGVTCPWCLGSWVAFAAVAVADYVTSVWLPGLQALAAAAAVGWLHGRLG